MTMLIQVLDDLVERLPEQFDMEDIRGRVDEFSPYVMVAIQVQFVKLLSMLQRLNTKPPPPLSPPPPANSHTLFQHKTAASAVPSHDVTQAGRFLEKFCAKLLWHCLGAS